MVDLLIVGAGPTGLACAIEAQRSSLKSVILEKGCLVNSIYNYPTNMVFFTTSELLEIGGLPFNSVAAKPSRLEAMEYYRRVAAHFELNVRQYERVLSIEPLEHGFRVLSEKLGGERQVWETRNVVLATGYYDLPNQLGVPGEDLPHVHHYYREAHPYAGLHVAVVGGKNFAAETSLDLYRHGAKVTIVHRRAEFSSSIKYWVKPDLENRIKAGEIQTRMETTIERIRPGVLELRHLRDGVRENLQSDFVFALIGYHPDFELLRSCGVRFDANMRPVCDPESYESNVPGLYLGGVIVAGRNTSEIFIENGRFHGKVIVDHILARREVELAARFAKTEGPA